MTSTSESQPKSAEAVGRAAVMTHGKPATIGSALGFSERDASPSNRVDTPVQVGFGLTLSDATGGWQASPTPL